MHAKNQSPINVDEHVSAHWCAGCLEKLAKNLKLRLHYDLNNRSYLYIGMYLQMYA
jgi:hypothetical protein